MQIKAGIAPVIDTAYVTPLHVCRNDTTHFFAHVTGPGPINYDWSYRDTLKPPGPPFVGGGIDDSISSWVYFASGTFHPYLRVSNYGCFDTVTYPLVAIVDSPTAAIVDTTDCIFRTKVKFFDATVGSNSRMWNFGDGDTSSQINPVHIYSQLGLYTVHLFVHNNTTGCSDDSFRIVHLFNDTLSIYVTDTAICKYDSLNLTPIYKFNNYFGFGYTWYVNNIALAPTVTGSPPYPIGHYFDTVAYNSVMLIAIDSNHCIDTAYRTVLSAKPTDHFTVSSALVCRPMSNVIFTDTSWFITGTTIASSYWNFGDGNTITVPSATTSHTYSQNGVYDIMEIVTDNIGCKDTLIKTAYVTVDRPTAAFNVSSTFPCIDDSVAFNNFSFNNIVGSHWLFGNGDSSSVGSPSEVFADTGSYTVTLIVTDNLGCRDTLVKPAYIKITKPRASFTMNDSLGICIPLNIQFTNTTIGGSTYNWSFGNGNNSGAFSPSNSYTVPGHDTIQLIATNIHGCKDTATGHAVLYGYAGSLTYNPLTGCPPMTVNFTANVLNLPFLRFDYNDGTVSAISSATTSTHIYTTPGAYVPKLIMSDNNNCQVSSIGLDTIKVDSVTARFVYNPSLICVHESIQFKDSSQSMFSTITGWQWLFNNGQGSTTATPTHIFDSSGQAWIRLVATDGIGCKDTLIDTVTVYPLPILKATGDTTICVGDAAPITVSSNITISTYSWSPSGSLSCSGCQSPNASPGTTTNYVITGTDVHGCINTDTVLIQTKTHIHTVASPGGEICAGQRFQLSDSGAVSYSWYPSDGLSNSQIADPVATPQYTIHYIVVGKTGSCAPDTNAVVISVDPLPTVNAGNDQTIVLGQTASLLGTGSNTSGYLWSPKNALSCDSCTDPTVIHVDETTTFTLIAWSKEGCIDSSHVTVHVICDHSQVFIPNSFTPNGDGQNDVFYPRGVGLRSIKSMRVYDRWGGIVFERENISLNDESNGWDGTCKGNKPRPDVYVYMIEGICETGETINWKGDVSIIR